MDKQRSGVLILDGTPRVVVVVARSLSKRGIPVVYGHFSSWAQSAGSVTVSTNIRLSDNPVDFPEQVSNVIEREHIDTLIPCSDKAIRTILPTYASLKQKVALSIPDPTIVNKVLDKEYALSAADRCGIRIPRTFSITNVDDLLARRQELGFPLIAKPSNAGRASSFKTVYFDSFEDLSSILDREPAFGAGTIFQELIHGEGVGVSTVMYRGAPLALFQHKRIHEWPASGGVAVFMESEPIDTDLAQSAVRLLQAISWEGPAMVEFRRTQTGDYVFLEVNGRFWGSLPLAVKAGIDFPYLEWQILHGSAPTVPAAYKQRLRMRWTAGEIRRLRELWSSVDARRRAGRTRGKALLEFIASFAPGVRSALFNIGDPKPGVAEVVGELSGISFGLLARIIPRSTRRRYRQYKQLNKRSRGAYLRLWFARMFGLRNARRLRRLSSVSSILFVCRGNIIRSPLAAALLHASIGDPSKFHIESAGTHVAAESQTDPRALRFAQELGIPTKGDPQNITEELARKTDLIVVMDYVLEAEVLTRFPFVTDKVFLLREWTLGTPSDLEILDPDKEPEPEFSRSLVRLRDAVTQLGQLLAARQ